MTIINTYAAEAWDKVYDAFTQVNFTAYDFDTVKESLIQYLQTYYPENFNDFIESSEFVALLELFAYISEQLAYRIDINSHENFITTAQRKASILRLAKLVSYVPSRNIPARGLVKITSVKTSETVYDSLGNNLANVIVNWNDPNNTNWKEQFFLVMNKVMTSQFGQPQKSFQIGDVLFQLFSFNNDASSFNNGVFGFSAGGSNASYPAEIVPIDIDINGPFERSPDLNAQMSIAYASDGRGDGSDYTGFLMFVKQGTLIRTDYTILEATENRRVELDAININDTDVWVNRVDSTGAIIENWVKVDALNEQNLSFNDQGTSRKKFEVETLENDRIALLFGDGNFSDAPIGDFQFWTRVSENANITIPKSQVVDVGMSFNYTNSANVSQSCSVTFSLTSSLQNNAASETIDHIRQYAPSTYYSQNRMVNGQDYNTYPLKDPTILRLKTINRTFAGQPKYIEWNDASGAYQNVKLFGDDLQMFYDVSANFVETATSSRGLIDSFIEPLLQQTGVFNLLNHVSATAIDANANPIGYGIISNPRRTFIQDEQPIFFSYDGTLADLTGNPADAASPKPVTPYGTVAPSQHDGSLKEKTVIQGALDRHWYGEPLSYVTINGVRHGLIADPTTATATADGNLYDDTLKRTIDGVNTWPPGDVGSGLQTFIAGQPWFGIRYNRFLKAFGNGTINLTSFANGVPERSKSVEVFTLEIQQDLTTVSVISNFRGAQPSGRIGLQYSTSIEVDSPPIDFLITQGTKPFAAGDAFIVEVRYLVATSLTNITPSGTQTVGGVVVKTGDYVGLMGQTDAAQNGVWQVMATGAWIQLSTSVPPTMWFASLRQFNNDTKVNLTGWFSLISKDELGFDPENTAAMVSKSVNFDQTVTGDSWVFIVKTRTDTSGNTIGYTVWYREMKLIVESPTTNFWYNQTTQILDPQTLKPVYDKIRILRSNLNGEGMPLLQNDIYDVVGAVYDANGVIIPSRLEILPSDSINFTTAGDGVPDNILQFEQFSAGSFEFLVYDSSTNSWSTLPCNSYAYVYYDQTVYEEFPYDSLVLTILSGQFAGSYTFTGSAFMDDSGMVLRRRAIPGPCGTGLDFMWQHFTPQSNLIDPSPTNIHDAFILTRGYYDDMMSYVNGQLSIAPVPPTPLELRTSYGSLLQNKVLSDTLVLHSGSLKLLFGKLADPQFRAKFRIVLSPTSTFSAERIKAEVISTINAYFDIQNWDFGDTFYATDLISLIHQRLATQISSAVLVPMYSVNSFGSLFTIDSGFDEILQSCATVDDVEIVDALTPTVLRQLR